MRKKIPQTQRGFTLIEMLVSVAIFTVMTTYLIVKYGTFNQGILLTNTAYDMALTMRQAQNYGINTQQAQTGDFSQGFGVSFSTLNPVGVTPQNPVGTTVIPNNKSFVFFPDIHMNDLRYSNASGEGAVRTLYILRRGVRVQSLCAGASDVSCSTVNELHVGFKRPNPAAIISTQSDTNLAYAKITISSEDGSLSRDIVVRRFGQISVGK